jgi:parallel beta-helix repeat protein
MSRVLFWILPLAIILAWEACPAKDREIWIGQRSDGKKGRGTAEDPFDGSTQQKFDKLLRGYWWRGVKDLTVHISAGTFETVGNGDYVPGLTNGVEGWRCNSGWTIIGAGRELTVLKIIKNFTGPDDVVGTCGISSSDSGVNNVTIQDLTVDCNFDAIGTNRSRDTGVSLQGSNHTIRRVTVKNVSGLGGESFPIAIGGVNVNSSKNLIEECTITGWKGGMGGSITIANNMRNMEPPYTYTSGLVRNNRVFGTHIGYGGWGMKNVTFSGNIAEGCSYGVNIDSLKNSKVSFLNNQFMDCRNYGLVLTNCANFKIQGNTVNLSEGTNFLHFDHSAGDIYIADNTFTALKPQSAIATTRDSGTLFGKFIFSKNTTSTVGGIRLPSVLVEKD